MSFTTVNYLIWIAVFTCSLTASILIWRQHSLVYLRFFVAYTFFECIDYALSLILYELSAIRALPQSWYVGCFWVLLFLEYALQVGVIYQLFHTLLKSYKILPDRAFHVFVAGCVAIVMISTIIVMREPTSFSAKLATIGVDIMLSFNLLGCAACFFIVAFASALGLPRRHFIVGIALGIGLINLGVLVTLAIASRYGMNSYGAIKHMPELIYLCSTLIWIDYFRRNELERVPLHPQMLGALQKLKRALDFVFTFAVNKP